MSDLPRAQVTRLLADFSEGSAAAKEELFGVVYQDLRAMAAAYLRRERHGHTLQPTALVHEAYCRLVDRDKAGLQDRNHFFAVAAQAMRRILVDHARKRGAKKRGGGRYRIALDRLPELQEERDAMMTALDDALTELAALDERQSRIVELRFFGGLTIEQAAEVLGISHATVERDWKVAKAWLHRELTRSQEEA